MIYDAKLELFLGQLNQDYEGTEDHLKRIAKYLKRRDGISHSEALNVVAQRIGYRDWPDALRDFS